MACAGVGWVRRWVSEHVAMAWRRNFLSSRVCFTGLVFGVHFRVFTRVGGTLRPAFLLRPWPRRGSLVWVEDVISARKLHLLLVCRDVALVLC